MSRQPAHKRWCDAQRVSILDGGPVDHTEADCTDHTPPLSTEYIIAQLQQLRDLLPHGGDPLSGTGAVLPNLIGDTTSISSISPPGS
jgi:hypothetical protein